MRTHFLLAAIAVACLSSGVGAHFVLVSRESITGPGLSVIDVKKSLRPSPLPGPGDWISAAGPVEEGSYGQSQIEAVRVRVAHRG